VSTYKQIPVVYVAGPFRGPDHWVIWKNINQAAELALEVWKMGAACICPHMNTFCFQGAAPDEIWLDGDLAILTRCDAILMTPDWQRSSGARAEHDIALKHGLQIFYTLDALKEWVMLWSLPSSSAA
jgi:hypothetical protein